MNILSLFVCTFTDLDFNYDFFLITNKIYQFSFFTFSFTCWAFISFGFLCICLFFFTFNIFAFAVVFSCPGSSLPDLGQSLTEWVTHRHFRILTQRVTFETWDPSDIWSEWCLDKKTERQKDRKTERQKDRKTERQKDKRQRPKREYGIATSGQFRTFAMFLLWNTWNTFSPEFLTDSWPWCWSITYKCGGDGERAKNTSIWTTFILNVDQMLWSICFENVYSKLIYNKSWKLEIWMEMNSSLSSYREIKMKHIESVQNQG